MRLKKGMSILLVIAVIGGMAAFLIPHYQAESEKLTELNEPLNEEGCLGLNYHRIKDENVWNKGVEMMTNSDELTTYTVYSDDFEDQLDKMIEENATFVTPDELREYQEQGEFPPNCVWISFDDADESIVDEALPILEERDIPFTVFVISGQVGEYDFESQPIADWGDLRTLRDSGLATIGSHTHDLHRLAEENQDKAIFLKEENKDMFAEDLAKSVDALESELDMEVTEFAYPFGEGSEALADISREQGMEGTHILAPRAIMPDEDPHWTNRILLSTPFFEENIVPFLEENNPEAS